MSVIAFATIIACSSNRLVEEAGPWVSRYEKYNYPPKEKNCGIYFVMDAKCSDFFVIGKYTKRKYISPEVFLDMKKYAEYIQNEINQAESAACNMGGDALFSAGYNESGSIIDIKFPVVNNKVLFEFDILKLKTQVNDLR
jgi:hypothetical protein